MPGRSASNVTMTLRRTAWIASIALLVAACGGDTATATGRTTSYSARDIAAALDSKGGKPLLINIWARWCKPCIAEFPALADMKRQIDQDGGELITVCVDVIDGTTKLDEAAERAPRFLGRRDLGDAECWVYNGSTLGPLFDAINLPDRFSAPSGIPVTLAVNAAGQVVDMHVGAAQHQRFEDMWARAQATPSGG